MRKGNSGEENIEEKRLMRIVATTSLPAVDRPTAGTPHARANNYVYSGHKHRCQSTGQMLTNWNADCLCQKKISILAEINVRRTRKDLFHALQ